MLYATNEKQQICQQCVYMRSGSYTHIQHKKNVLKETPTKCNKLHKIKHKEMHHKFGKDMHRRVKDLEGKIEQKRQK